MMEIVKGSDMTHLVFLMGFVVRLAMTMQLHRKTNLFPDICPLEAEMRKRVWVTIQLLDLDVAMRTGTSYLYREHDADVPMDINDADFHRAEHGWVIHPRWTSPGGLTDSTFQVRLAGLLPILTEITNTVNSPTKSSTEHEKIRAWDSQLRHKLQGAESVLTVPPYGQTDNLEKVNAQLQFLRVLVHRTLVALHHHHICALRAGPTRDSTISIMQSSLTLLRTQHTWQSPLRSGVQTRTSSSSSSGFQDSSEPTFPLGWLSDLCHDDFGAAMLHLVLAIRRGDFDNVKHGNLPSRSNASAILRQSLEHKRMRACRSIPHFREYVGLTLSTACLKSTDTGADMLTTLLEAAGQIEQTVLQGRQDLLWPQSGQFAGQAGLPPDPFVYGFGQ
ncbi:hypothetical protein OQA88_3639 [Cercophora sp. LCS_1]